MTTATRAPIPRVSSCPFPHPLIHLFHHYCLEQTRETQRTLTTEDLVSSIEYLINLTYDEGSCDDIDHLGNRRVRSVGELLQNQFRVGLSRIERIVKERMTLQNSESLTLVEHKTACCSVERILRFITVVTIYGPNKPAC